MEHSKFESLSRRALLQYGGAALAITASGLSRVVGAQSPAPHVDSGCGPGGEDYPTSPLILEPFRDPLLVPRALAPCTADEVYGWPVAPGPNSQDCVNHRHQLWPSQLGLPAPTVYNIATQVRAHRFTTSKVLPIDAYGNAVGHPLTGQPGPHTLPASTIYGYNGTFPGPLINAEYYRPMLVRFDNQLHLNPYNLDRGDFGSPAWASATHLHNAHTAPESDGNPHYVMTRLLQDGYLPGQWVDNLYLNYPPDGNSADKQSFWWFHDHTHGNTAENCYKGLIGLVRIYDPIADPGDETRGLRLPGVRVDRSDGAFDVSYDIPLVLGDVALDDGVTGHRDMHNGCDETHPEWWGTTFFRHYPNSGFVGDVFTVNGTAFPVLQVKRRKYRLRFLDAAVARLFRLEFMASTGGPVSSRSTGRTGLKLQGQYQLPDGQRCLRMTQIATEGGLLPFPILRDSFEFYPAQRKEVIVDFSRYVDGTPTTEGDAIYLVNTLQMTDGRKPDDTDDEDFDPQYRVPMLKFVIGGDAADNSRLPSPATPLRPLPPLPSLTGLPRRRFRLSRADSTSPELEWLINGAPFDPLSVLATPRKGSAEVWTLENKSGGWVHPFHIHQEEHRVVTRNGRKAPRPDHPDESGGADTVSLGPGDEVVVYRKFRTFTGPYAAHCHNLMHEDHAMMFAWSIV